MKAEHVGIFSRTPSLSGCDEKDYCLAEDYCRFARRFREDSASHSANGIPRIIRREIAKVSREALLRNGRFPRAQERTWLFQDSVLRLQRLTLNDRRIHKTLMFLSRRSIFFSCDFCKTKNVITWNINNADFTTNGSFFPL